VETKITTQGVATEVKKIISARKKTIKNKETKIKYLL
jgi:hypothetical protein